MRNGRLLLDSFNGVPVERNLPLAQFLAQADQTLQGIATVLFALTQAGQADLQGGHPLTRLIGPLAQALEVLLQTRHQGFQFAFLAFARCARAGGSLQSPLQGLMLLVQLLFFQAEDLDALLETGVLLQQPIKILTAVDHADFLLMQILLGLTQGDFR